MFSEIRQHPLSFFVLFLIAVSGGVAFFFFSYDSHWQRRIVYATSGLYFLWSLYHHHQKGDLELSIIFEYLVFILLALVVISTTLL